MDYTCALSFWAENNFEFALMRVGNRGTYEVEEGFIVITYTEGSKATVEIPYSIDENGNIDLRVAETFDFLK